MLSRALMFTASKAATSAPLFQAQRAQLQSSSYAQVTSVHHLSRRLMSAHKMSKKARAELEAMELKNATSLKYNKEETVFNSAAILTKFDVTLADKLRVAEKIIRPKPRTPSKRHLVRIDRSDLWKGRPILKLTMPRRRNGGRNNFGRITTRGRGGGTRRRLRIIDFKRSILDIPATIERLEYDPNRSCHIALVKYPDNRQAYILIQQGVTVGDQLMASRRRALDLSPGNAMALRHIPVGTLISCVELQPGHGPQLARSAGVSCELISKQTSARRGFGLLKLSSGEVRLINLDCLAVIGSMSNPLFHIRSLGKAGRRRWMGYRPISRGLAQNPVDHPHGGGAAQGRCGRPSISFSGVLAKGYKTRSVNKPSPFIHMTRHAARAKAKSSQ